METMVFRPETPCMGMISMLFAYIYHSFRGGIGKSSSSVAYITYCHTSYIPCVQAYLLTTNFNGSSTAGHFLHVPDILIGWVPITPENPSWDDGRGRREAGWTLHEQPPNAVAGESGSIASCSRVNPLAYIALELGLHIINAKSHLN